jgi:hypothetical protein
VIAFLTISSALANPCIGLDNVFVADAEGDCADYFTCVNGIANPARCPDGFYFDFARQMCYFSDQVVCVDRSDPCYGKPQWYFVPRPEDGCAAFYRCEFGVGVPLDCPEGFFFDYAAQMCNFPHLVDCQDELPTPPTPPTPATTTTEATTTTITPQTPPTPPTPSVNPTIPTAPTPTTSLICENECEGRSDMLLPYPEGGCAAYIQCINGYAMPPRLCPEPYYFDFPEQMCNWQDQVDCVSHKF